jgi:hypothetical protein
MQPIFNRYYYNLVDFIRVLQLVLCNKNCPSLQFGKEKIHKSGLLKVWQDIRLDICYPALPDVRCPALR